MTTLLCGGGDGLECDFDRRQEGGDNFFAAVVRQRRGFDDVAGKSHPQELGVKGLDAEVILGGLLYQGVVGCWGLDDLLS